MTIPAAARFLAFCLLLSIWQPALSQDRAQSTPADRTLVGECDEPAGPSDDRVGVVADLQASEPDHSLSAEQISKLGRQRVHPGFIRLGYTLKDPKRPEVEFVGTAEKVNFGGNLCFYADQLKARWPLPVKIYIASEYAGGSCPYNVLLEHEQKHVSAFRKVLDEYAEILRVKLERAAEVPRKGKPMVTSDPAGAEKRATATIRNIADEVYKEYLARLNQTEATLDTRAEYRRMHASCSDAEWRPWAWPTLERPR